MVFYIFVFSLFHPQLEENLSNSDTISSLAKVGLSQSRGDRLTVAVVFMVYICGL